MILNGIYRHWALIEGVLINAIAQGSTKAISKVATNRRTMIFIYWRENMTNWLYPAFADNCHPGRRLLEFLSKLNSSFQLQKSIVALNWAEVLTQCNGMAIDHVLFWVSGSSALSRDPSSRHFGRVFGYLDGFGRDGQPLKYPLLDGWFWKSASFCLNLADLLRFKLTQLFFSWIFT